MRLLDRTRVAAPACLAGYRANPHATWNDLRDIPEDYQAVFAALVEMQGNRCAYCDCDLSKNRRHAHVEHFVQQHRRPDGAFDWSNLFLSCSSEECCGKHKDKVVGSYADEDVVKPDQVEPREFISFDRHGRAWAKNNCRVGVETIRVFALDCKRLRGARRSYLAAIVAELDRYVAIGVTAEELMPVRKELAAEYQRHPFRSAVLDILGL